MFGSRAARGVRGIAAAAVATLAAALSHSAADARPAPMLGVLLAMTVAVPLCVALAGRRMSWTRLGLAVGVSQFVFHGLLLIGITDHAVSPDAAPGMAPHLVGGAMAMAPLPAGTAMPPAMHADLAMWLAHAGAAVVAVLAIGHGERALAAMVRLVRSVLLPRLLQQRSAAPVCRRAVPVPALVRIGSPAAVLCAMRRRGPPLAA